MHIAHTCLNVDDAAAAVEWYAENLGFEETWSWSWETDEGTVESRYVADENGMELQLRSGAGIDPSEAGDLWDHLGLIVDDVDETAARIDHDGFVMEPQDNPDSGARIAFVRTPHGHVLELLAPFDDE
ncbi:MAG: VOC family protein [Salinigranum sp.]